MADESQWDEAVCNLAGCQHPQCWASLRRIERGHPRILDPSPKSPRETEGVLASLCRLLHKVPMLFLLDFFSSSRRLHVLLWCAFSDKLPTLTVVNITDSCLWTRRRVVQQQPSEFTFPKEGSSLLKPASKRQSRSVIMDSFLSKLCLQIPGLHFSYLYR